jgi:hypothetical protein
MPLTAHDIHTCHPTATNLNSSRNNTPFTNHETHNSHPTATNLSPNLNSTSSTNYETHNSHPTATRPLESTIYTPHPLSTPTSDCQAVPDTVG